jgi:hypothetical protein
MTPDACIKCKHAPVLSLVDEATTEHVVICEGCGASSDKEPTEEEAVLSWNATQRLAQAVEDYKLPEDATAAVVRTQDLVNKTTQYIALLRSPQDAVVAVMIFSTLLTQMPKIPPHLKDLFAFVSHELHEFMEFKTPEVVDSRMTDAKD